MKQYSPVLKPFPFSSSRERNEPFFEPHPFLKTTRDKIRLKWFAPCPDDFFLLAIKGLDAQIVKEIVLLLKSKTRLNLDEGEAMNLGDMMEVVGEFTGSNPSELSHFSKHEDGEDLSTPPTDPPLFLAVVDEKIEENLGNEHFRGGDLAKLLCCCEMQLYRKIKQLTQLSPANYIRRYRLHRSLMSLQESDLPISQVCFNVGFHSLEYFSRSFKKEFGLCPSAFRAGKNV